MERAKGHAWTGPTGTREGGPAPGESDIHFHEAEVMVSAPEDVGATSDLGKTGFYVEIERPGKIPNGYEPHPGESRAPREGKGALEEQPSQADPPHIPMDDEPSNEAGAGADVDKDHHPDNLRTGPADQEQIPPGHMAVKDFLERMSGVHQKGAIPSELFDEDVAHELEDPVCIAVAVGANGQISSRNGRLSFYLLFRHGVTYPLDADVM